MKAVFILSALLVLSVCSATQLASVISPAESDRLASLLQGKYSDLESAYYSVTGLTSLSKPVGDTEKESACDLVQNVDITSVAALGLAGTLNKELACGSTFPEEATALALSKLSSPNMKVLSSAVSFLTSVGHEVDSAEVVDALLKSLKNDNSVLKSSLAISAASKLVDANLKDFVATVDIEDMAAQADEVDSKYLHFEADLETTSSFLTAVFSLSEATSKAPVISSSQMVQLTNYVLRTKNSVSSAKDSCLILQPLGKIIASNDVTLAKMDVLSGTAISENRPKIQLLFNDLFSQPIAGLSVAADSLVRSSDNEMVLSDAPFVFDGLRLYELEVNSKKPKSGFYDASLSVKSKNGGSLVGLSTLEFRVKVTAKIALKNVQLGTAEKEQASGTLKKFVYLPIKIRSLLCVGAFDSFFDNSINCY